MGNRVQRTRIIPERSGAVSHDQGPLISRCDYFLGIVNQHGVTFYVITWSDNSWKIQTMTNVTL